jgi:hypothetical protein
MVSKNSQTNCILFPLHLLITMSIIFLHQPLQLTNPKQVSHLGAITLIYAHPSRIDPALILILFSIPIQSL